MSFLFLDYEFNRILEPVLNLVCCCTYDPVQNKKIKWWLHNDPDEIELLKGYIHNFDILVGYADIAEARSLISMGMEPLDFKWIDLFLEYRCLTNHNDELQWGKQLVDGKIRTVKKPRPKWEREEGEAANSFKATHSLAEATYKLLGVIRDTEHKDRMRKLIISDPKTFSETEREEIMDYCMEDVESLPDMWNEMVVHYMKNDEKLSLDQLVAEAKVRGRFAAHTAWMETKGYPVDIPKTKNFSKQVGNILYDCQRQINEYFPDVKPFKWNRPEQKMSWNQVATREWIKANHSDKKWMKTDGGDLSLALEAFEKFFDYKHSYPTDSFGAQMVRYLKLKQSLYGFVPTAKSGNKKEKKTFWDSVGSDGRVRPYTNIFGAQSSRSQPGSTGFMFLKPAWMRALVSPKPGMAMAGIDYGSEEYFISAILAQDINMINAYLSGDVYLAFAKDAKIVPMDATKELYKIERDICKNTVLAISFLMTKYGLAIKLSNDSGKVWTEDEAQILIDKFYGSYPQLAKFQEQIYDKYQLQGYLKLPCGWYLWGHNENQRSVSNCPIQGMGASILRKAVDLAVSRGLYVCFTLHDALYIEYAIGEEHQIEILRDCMREAFVFYFDEKMKDTAAKIKLDPFAWSPDYEKDSKIVLPTLTVPASNIYLDERAEKDYDTFSKYFEDPITDLL